MKRFISKWKNQNSIIALEYNYQNDNMTVYSRNKDKNVVEVLKKGEYFKPFLYYSTNKENYNIVRHSDDFKTLRGLKKNYEDGILLHPETQFLIQNQTKLYAGMALSDMKLAVWDIETTGLEKEKETILAIGVKTNYMLKNGKNTIFFKNEGDGEKAMLIEFLNFIIEEDPDIMVGHNVFEFDFPFVEHRMNLHKIPLQLGRNKSLMYKDFYTTKVNRLIPGSDFYQYRLPGRYVVDTMHLAQIEDTRRNEFESYSLKYLAQHLKIAPKDRVYIEGNEIKNFFKTDFEKFTKYLKDDLEETEGLMKLFLPAYFQMSRIIPITLQNQIYAGATRKFTSLFIGDYYINETALPLAEETRKFQGATTSAELKGIFFNVAKYDVSSLYPSTMRYKGYFPRKDILGVFEKYLIQFMDERLLYKRKAEEVEGKDDKLYEEYYAYQLALKILINSFYGVLGTGGFIFNDFDMADAVTKYGREVLQLMVEFLRDNKCEVIEIDTDGCYFTYPKDTDPDELLKDLNSKTEDGINIDFEKKFRAMLSYKDKTYVTMPENYPKKDITIKGSAFKKRGMQTYLKKSLKKSFETLLLGDVQGYKDNILLLKKAIANRELAIEEVMDSRRISYDYKHYINRAHKAKISVFEAMRKEGKEKFFQAGDKVRTYYQGETITKQKSDMVKLYDEDCLENDYNVDYYISKLIQWESDFAPFLKQIEETNGK